MHHRLHMRLARLEDCEAIAELLERSFEMFRPLYTVDAFNATICNPLIIYRRIAEGRVFIASTDDAIIGTVSVIMRQHDLYIRGMAVHPNSRGQKIGWKLYQLYHKTTHIFQPNIVEMFVENARHSTTMTALFASILTNYF